MEKAQFYVVIYGTNQSEEIKVFNDLEAADLLARSLGEAEISHWQFAICAHDGQRIHDVFVADNREVIGGVVFDRVGGKPDLSLQQLTG